LGYIDDYFPLSPFLQKMKSPKTFLFQGTSRYEKMYKKPVL